MVHLNLSTTDNWFRDKYFIEGFSMASPPERIYFKDMNKDGKLDLVVIYLEHKSHMVCRGWALKPDDLFSTPPSNYVRYGNGDGTFSLDHHLLPRLYR
ncbi:hypothetical protein HY212_02260 [Candidatus Pacearchaeota archaeon]|nr:hypothetical protein [Candidatus Pacearchaeota archaeon]